MPSSNYSIPVQYGGHFGVDHFSNTCPVDNWLALLYSISTDHPVIYNDLITNYCQTNAQFSLLLSLIKERKIMESKYHLATMNQLETTTENCYDFYGNESKFTEKCLNCIKFILKNDISSTCSSEYCQVKDQKQTTTGIPTMAHQDGISGEKFISAILNWLTGLWNAPCHRKLTGDPLPEDKYIHWDINSLT